MASASTFTIVTMPQQYDDDALLLRYVEKYRKLRLGSLKSDPDSFSSTFAGEINQPFGFWKDRITTPSSLHLIAVRLCANPTVNLITDDPHAILDSEWVGMLVVLGGRTVAIDDQAPWKSLARGRFVEDGMQASIASTASAYHLVGFYVAPESRGQGLGGSLVQKAVEAIDRDAQERQNSRAMCTVGVSDTNLVTKRLFKRLGFLEVAEEEYDKEGGQHWKEIVLRRNLPL